MKVSKSLVLLTVTFFLSLSAATAGEKPFDKLSENVEQANINKLLEVAADKPQIKATIYTVLGRPDKAYDFLEVYAEQGYCHLNDSDKKLSGKVLVAKEFANHKIIMINENHFNVASRAIAAKWLPWLKEQGFNYMGFEAYAPEDNAAEQTYFQDPIMSNLIQKAEKLGFNVFGYEAEKSAPQDMSFSQAFAFRDHQQAENVVDKIKNAPDTAKFVLFAGWAHVAEAPLPTPNGDKYRTLADFLHNDFGYDPLTIDTTACPYDGDTDNPTRSFAYLNGDKIKNVGSVQNVDIQLRVPKALPTTPGFFRKSLGDTYLPKIANWPKDQGVLLQAYHLNSDYIADRVMSDAGEKLPLYLKKGEYKVSLHDLNGNLLWENQITQE